MYNVRRLICDRNDRMPACGLPMGERIKLSGNLSNVVISLQIIEPANKYYVVKFIKPPSRDTASHQNVKLFFYLECMSW